MPLSRVTQVFHDALDDVALQVDFIASSIELRKRSAEIFSIGEISPWDQSIVQQFREARVGNAEPTFTALYVSICFHFEEFIRESHRVALVEINTRYPRVEQLRASLLERHLTATGSAMAGYYRDSRIPRVDIHAYARNAASCVAGAPGYKLNADVFAFFFRTASSEGIERLFDQIGLRLEWDQFGRNADLRQYFRGGGPREVGKLARNFLDEFVINRNRIVHRGGGYPQVSDSLVLSAAEFFKPFSSELSSIIQNFCAGYDRFAK